MTSYLQLARSSAILNRRIAISRQNTILNTRDQLSSSPSPTTTNCCGVRNFSGVGTMAENQIGEWLRRGGDDALQNKGKSLDTEANRHKYAATTFGVGADYVQIKILADNNIKPPSIERRIELDKRWAKLKAEIRRAYYKESSSSQSQ